MLETAMDQTNPYQAPSSHPSPVGATTGEVNPDVLRILAGTKGWARFLAVLGFIWAALLLIGTMVILSKGSSIAMFVPGLIGMIAFVYLTMAILSFVAALKLNQYAGRIGTLLSQPSQINLVMALDAQRGFWKFVGIVAAATIALYVILIFIGAAS